MKVKPLISNNGVSYVSFRCPGCSNMHVIPVTGPNAWGYNQNPDSPTLTPSILTHNGHFAPGWKTGDPCWCDMPDAGFNCVRCHSFVTDGQIKFLDDCSHDLKGKTVELDDISDK